MKKTEAAKSKAKAEAERTERLLVREAEALRKMSADVDAFDFKKVEMASKAGARLISIEDQYGEIVYNRLLDKLAWSVSKVRQWRLIATYWTEIQADAKFQDHQTIPLAYAIATEHYQEDHKDDPRVKKAKERQAQKQAEAEEKARKKAEAEAARAESNKLHNEFADKYEALVAEANKPDKEEFGTEVMTKEEQTTADPITIGREKFGTEIMTDAEAAETEEAPASEEATDDEGMVKVPISAILNALIDPALVEDLKAGRIRIDVQIDLYEVTTGVRRAFPVGSLSACELTDIEVEADTEVKS